MTENKVKILDENDIKNIRCCVNEFIYNSHNTIDFIKFKTIKDYFNEFYDFFHNNNCEPLINKLTCEITTNIEKAYNVLLPEYKLKHEEYIRIKTILNRKFDSLKNQKKYNDEYEQLRTELEKNDWGEQILITNFLTGTDNPYDKIFNCYIVCHSLLSYLFTDIRDLLIY